MDQRPSRHDRRSRFSRHRGAPYVLCLALLVISPHAGYCQLKTTGASQVSIARNNSVPESGKENVEPVIPHGSDFVIFSSLANNLIANHQSESTSATHNIFLHKPGESQPLELVSAIPSGNQQAPRKVGNSNLAVGCKEPAVSDVAADGSFAVAFTCDANDLVDNYEPPTGDDTIGPTQVYLRIFRPDSTGSLQKTTLLVSEAYSPSDSDDHEGANAASDQPTVARFPSESDSVSHRFTVCFRSMASDFIGGGETQSSSTIYCRHGIGYSRDGQNGDETFIPGTRSEVTDNMPLPGAEGHRTPQLSRDGRWLAFSSDLPLLGNNYVQPRIQVYLYSLNDEQLSLVSFDERDIPSSGYSETPSISHDGTFVAFVYSPFPIGDTNPLKGFNGYTRPFLVRFNTEDRTYLQVNSNSLGEPSNGQVYSGRIDDSGRYAVFSDSGATLLGSPDNTISQVFFKDLEPSGVAAPGGRLLTVSVSRDPELIPGSNHSGLHGSTSIGRHVSIGSHIRDGTTRFLTAFTSYAPNFNGVGVPTSAPYIFSSSVFGDFDDPATPDPTPTATPTPTIEEAPGVGQPRPLTPNIPIEDPPLVEVLPSKKPNNFSVRIVCQPFTISRRPRARGIISDLAARNSRIKYAIEIRKAGSRRRITQVSSRNVVTVRKLTPGQYTVRYRVSAQVGNRTIRSQKSPPATITLS